MQAHYLITNSNRGTWGRGPIYDILDGNEWDCDTPLNIANLLSDAGFEIKEPSDVG